MIHKTNILVVDDDKFITESIVDVLTVSGFDTITAKNGSEAIKVLYESGEIIDLIIADIMMPEMSGLEFLNRMYRYKEYQHIPVILLSGNNSRQFIKEGFRKGAIEFLDKPFENQQLVATIHSVLDEHKPVPANLQRLREVQKLEDIINNVSHINSHQLRHENSKLMQIANMVEEAQLNAQDAMIFVNKIVQEMDLTTIKMQEMMDNRLEILKNRLTDPRLSNLKFIWFVDDDLVTNVIHENFVRAFMPEVRYKSFTQPQNAAELLGSGYKDVPDAIFLDLNMPVMGGFDFLDFMQEHNIEIPVVILSSSTQKTDIDKSLSYSNVVTYLTKPLSKEMLMLLTHEPTNSSN